MGQAPPPTLRRLRNTLLIRVHNNTDTDADDNGGGSTPDVRSVFFPLACRNRHGISVVSRVRVARAAGIRDGGCRAAVALDGLLERAGLHVYAEYPYYVLLDFLERGEVIAGAGADDDLWAQMARTAPSDGGDNSDSDDSDALVYEGRSDGRPAAPVSGAPRTRGCVYGDTWGILHFRPPVETRELVAFGRGRTSGALPTIGDGRGNVWKKQETLVEERTVRYTTVEPDGATVALVERERTVTDVVHMESKHNGEFAHRETTHYERNESFDGDAVSQSHGFEEYLHLKSQHDEYETTRGSGCPLARKRRDEEEEREVAVREAEAETEAEAQRKAAAADLDMYEAQLRAAMAETRADDEDGEGEWEWDDGGGDS